MIETTHLILLLGLFLPLAGAVTLLLTSRVISRCWAGLVGCLSIFGAFLCFVGLLWLYTQDALDPITVVLYQWMPGTAMNTDVSLHLDPLSLVMTLIITGVGFLIHVYSVGYMEHDEDYARYFAEMNFFVFSMLLLVLGGNLIVLFVGWEGVGLASYLLIGYYYTRPAAAQAATKAFVINRIGDLGLLLGILMTFHLFGTTDIEVIAQKAVAEYPVGAPMMLVLCLLYFIGATGKSAQIPLHTWLPDAMEGPTPVSALIHAATMVTAGVYLVVRLHPIFMLAPVTLHLIGIIGAITALFAALCASGQHDLKRVLAYSTVSQLGLMFLACGVGAFYAAMFHLTTHAFVKALLFLSAGDVVHGLNGATDMDKMGGLKSVFKKTHILFGIGVLALSGIPPMAAFYSKELILEQEHLAGFDTLFWIGLIASTLTAFYLTRAYCMTFLGTSNLEPKIFKAAKEAPKIMLIPVSILAFLAIFGGFLGFAFGKEPILEGFLAEVGVTLYHNEPSDGFLWTPETAIAICGGLLGLGSAAFLYTRYRDHLGATWKILKKSFYIDEIYWTLIGRPLEATSRFLSKALEPNVFDGSIHAITRTTQGASKLLQRIQSGQIRSYVAWIAVGAVILILYFGVSP